MNRFKYLLALSVLYPTTLGHAQKIVPPTSRRSMFSNAASIFTVSSDTRIPMGSIEAVYLKPPTDQSATPLPWVDEPSSSNGQYSMETLFGSDMDDFVEIDAMSTGNAYIPTTQGKPTIPAGFWAAAMISVDNDGNVGLPGQGWFAERANGDFGTRDTPGADLVTHFMEESEGIHHSIRGATLFMQLAEHLGLTVDQDIDSIDLAGGVIRESGNLASKLLFTEVRHFFFSVSINSAIALNLEYPNGIAYETDPTTGIADLVLADPAAVYRMEWDDTDHEWGVIHVYLTREDLGLALLGVAALGSPGPGSENIDALAVEKLSPQSTALSTVVFSTQPIQGRSQLMVFEPDLNSPTIVGAVFELKADGAGTASLTEAYALKEWESTGSQGDDVDAICFFDPEILKYDDLIGFSADTSEKDPLGLAIQRVDEDGTDHKLTYQVTGEAIPPPVDSGKDVLLPNPVVLVYYWEASDTNPLPPAPGHSDWHLLAGAPYPDLATDMTRALPTNVLPDHDGNVFFFAEVRDYAQNGHPLIRRSWVSGLRY